jgi:hypothetical protein
MDVPAGTTQTHSLNATPGRRRPGFVIGTAEHRHRTAACIGNSPGSTLPTKESHRRVT